MCDVIEIFPDSLRTGVPITARVHSEHRAADVKTLTVVPQGQAGLETFVVPLTEREGHTEGQFMVSFPGKYRLTLGKLTREIHVEPQRDLTFQAEFGFFSFAVVILVGGMVVWLRKQKH